MPLPQLPWGHSIHSYLTSWGAHLLGGGKHLAHAAQGSCKGARPARWMQRPPGSSELGDGAREGSERTCTASLGVLLLLGGGRRDQAQVDTQGGSQS